MKKILYSLILSTVLLTSCGSDTDVPDESVVESTVDDTFPISTIETELADHINSVSPYSDDLVKRVYVTQDDDNIFISVHLNCHGFDSIGQELILVRDSVVEYTNENDYSVSTLDICSITSDSDGILWMSGDLKEGSYVDKVNNTSISLISLEDIAKSDTYILPKSQSVPTDEIDSDVEKPEISDLFKSVYLPYSNRRELHYTFNEVSDFVISTEYKVEITEPTSDDLAQIKVTDENNNYVYFAFSPKEFEGPRNIKQTFECMYLASYYQSATNSEVSFMNVSPNRSPIYDRYFTHVIGKNEIEVRSINDQLDFLFEYDDADLELLHLK